MVPGKSFLQHQMNAPPRAVYRSEQGHGRVSSLPISIKAVSGFSQRPPVFVASNSLAVDSGRGTPKVLCGSSPPQFDKANELGASGTGVVEHEVNVDKLQDAVRLQIAAGRDTDNDLGNGDPHGHDEAHKCIEAPMRTQRQPDDLGARRLDMFEQGFVIGVDLS